MTRALGKKLSEFTDFRSLVLYPTDILIWGWDFDHGYQIF